MMTIEASGSLIKSLTPPFQSDRFLLELDIQLRKGIPIQNSNPNLCPPQLILCTACSTAQVGSIDMTFETIQV